MGAAFKRWFLVAVMVLFGWWGCVVMPHGPAIGVPAVSADTGADGFPAAAESPAGTDATAADDGGVPFIQRLTSVSVRGAFSGTDLLGEVAPEAFREYGVAATFRLPWGWYGPSGWGVGTGLMAGAGALHGAGETALVVSLIPQVTLGRREGTFTLDLGAGGAALSRDHFGTQDFGGWFQFALTAGAGVALSQRLGVGYRFLHYSDAGLHGAHTTGADMHLLELLFRF